MSRFGGNDDTQIARKLETLWQRYRWLIDRRNAGYIWAVANSTPTSFARTTHMTNRSGGSDRVIGAGIFLPDGRHGARRTVKCSGDVRCVLHPDGSSGQGAGDRSPAPAPTHGTGARDRRE